MKRTWYLVIQGFDESQPTDEESLRAGLERIELVSQHEFDAMREASLIWNERIADGKTVFRNGVTYPRSPKVICAIEPGWDVTTVVPGFPGPLPNGPGVETFLVDGPVAIPHGPPVGQTGHFPDMPVGDEYGVGDMYDVPEIQVADDPPPDDGPESEPVATDDDIDRPHVDTLDHPFTFVPPGKNIPPDPDKHCSLATTHDAAIVEVGELIKRCRFDRVAQGTTGKFLDASLAITDDDVMLVHIGREVSNLEVAKELDQRGYLSLGFRELLKLALANRNLQRAFPIVAMAIPISYGGKNYYPVLSGHGRERRLDMHPVDQKFAANTRFLAVKK